MVTCRSWLCFAMLVGALTTSAPAAPIYVHVDKVSPEGSARVLIDAQGVPAVDLAVFRASSPRAFFDQQKNVDEPLIEGTALREALDRAILASPLKAKPTPHTSPGDPRAAGACEFTLVEFRTIPIPQQETKEDQPPPKVPVALDLKQPGLYLIEASFGPSSAYATALVSKMTVISRRLGSQLVCFAVERESGRPVAGVSISAGAARGETGADGLWLARASDPRLRIAAEKGEDFFVATLDHYAASAEGPVAFLYTDRPVYRPGEEVHFKGIVRRYAAGNLVLVTGAKVKVQAVGPDGKALELGEFALSETGTFSGSFPTAETAPLGGWRLVATIDGAPSAAEFAIEKYRKPEYAVGVTTDPGRAIMGQKVSVTVKADYFFGAPVKGGAVEYRVYRSRWERDLLAEEGRQWYLSSIERAAAAEEVIAEGKGALDDAGLFTFAQETVKQPADYLLRIETTVTDQGRQAVAGGGLVPVAASAVQLAVRTNRAFVKPNEPIEIAIKALDLDGRAQERDVTLTISTGEPRRTLLTKDLRTGEAGTAAFTFTPKDQGQVLLEVVAKDAEGRAAKAEDAFWVAEGDATLDYRRGRITVLTDKPQYAPGETVRLLILSPVVKPHCLTTLEGETLESPAVAHIQGNARVLELKATEALSPNVFYTVTCVHNDKVYTGSATVLVPPARKTVDVQITANQSEYRPRDEGTITVSTADWQGRPLSAEVSLAVVDEALFAIAPDRTPDLVEFFYPLRRSATSVADRTALSSFGGPVQWDEKASQALFAPVKEHVDRLTKAKMTISGKDLAIQAVLAKIEAAAGLKIALDEPALGTAKKKALTFEREVEDAPASAVLAWLLNETGLFAAVERDRIVITSRDRLLQFRYVRPGATPGEQGVLLVLQLAVEGKDDKITTGQTGARVEAQYLMRLERVMPGTPEPARPPAEISALHQRLSRSALLMREDADGQGEYGLVGELGKAQPGPAAPAQVRKEFATTILWAAQVKTDEKGLATLKVRFPDNLTRWRLTGRAATAASAFGEGRHEVQTTKHTILQVGLPRFLRERDWVTVPTIVHNLFQSRKEVEVSLAAKGVTVEPAEARRVSIEPGRSAALDWKLLTTPAGRAVISGKALTTEESDAVELELPVLPHGIEQVLAYQGEVDEEAETVVVNVPASAAPGSARVTVTVSHSVAGAMLAALDYLEGYPYGCTEQTMSKFVPDLAAQAALSELGVAHQDLDKRLPVLIEKGIARLGELQHDDGGWGWWKDDATRAEMTAYVLEGLCRARDLKQTVPTPLIHGGAEALARLLGQKAREEEVTTREARLLTARGGVADLGTQAHAILAMALAGKDVKALAAPLYDQPLGLIDPKTLAVLARAASYAGRGRDLVRVVEELERRAVVQDQVAHWGKTGASEWQDDPVETTAYVVETLCLVDPDSALIDQGVKFLLRQRKGEVWKSTRDTAAAVEALAAWLKLKKAKGLGATEAAVTLNGQRLGQPNLSPANPFARVEAGTAEGLKPGHNEIVIGRSGPAPILYSVTVRYYTTEEDIPAGSNELKVVRGYSLLVSKKTEKGFVWERRPLPDKVPSGALVLADLTVTVPRQVQYFMLEDALPAGAESVTLDASFPVPDRTPLPDGTHREFHDERVAFFLATLPAGEAHLSHIFRTTLAGDYHVIPAVARLMYFPDVRGNSTEHRLTVVKE